MDKQKLLGILEGAVIIALGVLIAIFGFATVVDIYFGIVACVVGAALLGVSVYAMTKKELTFGLLGLGAILVAVGIGLLVHQLWHLFISKKIHNLRHLSVTYRHLISNFLSSLSYRARI